MDMDVSSVGAAAGAMAAVLIAVFAAFRFNHSAGRGTRPRAEPQPEPEPVALPPYYLFWGAVSWGCMVERAIASLPRRELKETAECAICIRELAAGETARVLPRCGHAFHMECVDRWLGSCRANCPLCRRDVVHINDMVMPAPLRRYPRVQPGPPVPFVRNRNLN